MALWVTNTDLSYNDLRFDNENVKTAVDRILNAVNNQGDTQDVTFEVSPDAKTASLEGDFYKAGPFKITTNAKGNFTTETINAPQNSYFTNANGEKKTSFSANEEFYVHFGKNSPSGKFNIKVTGQLEKTETLWYKSHDAGIQNAIVLLKTTHTPVKENIAVDWTSKGAIELEKVSDSSKKLAGATFDIKNSNGETVKTITTDNNGYAKVNDLELGEYTVVETKAPNGYILNANPQKVVVENGVVKNVKVSNESVKGNVEIHKTDDSKKPIQGVEFTAFDENGKEVAKAVTNKDGIAKFDNLPFGDYSFKETRTPAGYEGSTESGIFKISENGSTQTFDVVNKVIKGNIVVKKVDENGKTLEGVEFTVFTKDGKEVAKVKTDKNGVAKVDSLPYGDYFLKETKGLPGYILSEDVMPFKVEKSTTQEFTVENKIIKGSIEITKVDENKKALEGVEFTVFTKNGKEVTKVKTDKNGVAKVDNLPYGDYFFKETKGLPGYVINGKPVEFSIKENGKINKITVENKLIRGSIEIKKEDEDKKALEGVEFTVFTKDGKEVTKVKTDKNGVAKVDNLPYGDYYFNETKTVKGFVLDSKKAPFSVKENGKTDKFKVTNKFVRGNVEIKKVDDNLKALEGVEFTVFTKDGKEIAKVKTDKNGVAKFDNLKYGEYYFQETKEKSGYVKNPKKYEFSINENGKTLKYDVTNKLIKGHIEIKKVDENGKALKGVEFTAYDQNNKEVKKVETNKDGIAKVENLPFGKYYFKESKTIEGFVLNPQKFPFDIKENNKTLTFTVTNNFIKGNVKLVKVDAENNDVKLEGAVYELYDATNEKVGEYTTDKNGEIAVQNLVYGNYKFVEKESPLGFVLDKKEIPFEVKENGQLIELTATNKKVTGTLEITKVDVADSKELPGAKFEIFNEKGEKVVEKVTDENGKAVFEKLSYGKYTFRETVAPDGYTINETVFEFEILEDGKIIKHTVEDEKIPTPEQPKPEQPKPEQPKPEQPKHEMPQTGGSVSKLPLIGFGLAVLAGIFFVLARRNKGSKQN